MVATERKLLRKRLDKEMRYYRLAGREQNPTSGLLRAVREALRIPFKEMTERMGVVRSAVFDLEEREGTGSITLQSLGRVAAAMGCKVVYGIIPASGKTLEEMAEERLWREVIGSESKPASQRAGKSGNSAAADKATNREAA
jgi:predicted DNA-binding mobile mystery protein A